MFSTKMASSTSRIFSSPSTLRRRLPIVGAFCMLTLGLTNLYTPLYSSALKTECVRSISNSIHCYLSICFVELLLLFCFRSKLSSRFSTKSSNFIRMEGNTNNTTVPSIVVYVTVPNKEAGRVIVLISSKLMYLINLIVWLFVWFDACYWFCAGKKLAESIVTEKLAACVSRVPGNNSYALCFVHSSYYY